MKLDIALQTLALAVSCALPAALVTRHADLSGSRISGLEDLDGKKKCQRGAVEGPATWYVAPTGSAPSDQCGEAGKADVPFGEISLLQKVIAPGDTVLLLPGEYKNEHFGDGDIWKDEDTLRIWKWKGAEGQWITIRPDQEGTVTVKCDSSNAVLLRTCKYVRLSGLKIIGEVQNIPLEDAEAHKFIYKDKNDEIQYRVPQGTSDHDVAAMTLPKNIDAFRPPYFGTKGLLVHSSRFVEVLDNEVGFMPGTGLRIQGGDRVTVRGNTVHDNSRRSSIGTHGLVLHSLESKDGGEDAHIIVEGNTVFNNYNEVYSWSEKKDFVHPEIDEGKGITVQKTTGKWNNGKGRIVIRNNVCYNNGFSGVHVNQGARVDVLHNTLYNNIQSGKGNNVGISFAPCADCKAINNIVVAESTWGGFALQSTKDDVQFLSNIVVGQVDDVASSQSGASIAQDPLFVDAAGHDFHLQASSPAINQGQLGLADKDFDGHDRDSTPDIGAFEFQQ